MSRISRRSMLIGTGAAGLTMGPLLNLFASSKARAQPPLPPQGPTYGLPFARFPLNMAELPPERQGIAFMSLPDGFEYSVLSYSGQTMSDGNLLPGAADGMAAFRGPRGGSVLVRNHELSTGGTAVVAPDATYDPAVRGGTTTAFVSAEGKLLKQIGSLAGTERNCAGGPTPWSSWLTCEETVAIRDGVRHGYVFEVPAGTMGDASPLVRLGRFNHEAAAIDPNTGYVYLTEDRGDSLLYRFRPAGYGDLHSPGQLEALRLSDWPTGIGTRTGFLGNLSIPLASDWIPIDEYDPATDTVRAEGQSKGAATFSRGEGCWHGNGVIYWVCSDGGDARRGQVFAYDPLSNTTTLFVESTDAAALDAPDNITVAPDGRLYLCEDGGGGDNIVGVNHDGSTFILANNLHSGSEFAGACFSHDSRFMFVNMQGDGLTFVIQGPWT